MIFHDCSADGTGPSDNSLDGLAVGGQVMLVAYVPIELLAHRCPFWVRLTQIAIPSGWLGDRTWVAGSSLLHYDDLDRIRLTGVTTEDDMVGLPIGTVVRFLRRNVREIG